MEPDRLDRFVRGRAAPVAAFLWGFCEATFFFLVPDVLLTLIACRSARRAWRACLAALLGALLGGALMYATGVLAGARAEAFLDFVPGIGPGLIETVRHQIGDLGATGILLGPLGGVPYKIYAVAWGSSRGGLLLFLAVSIPARLVRFLVTAGAAALIVRGLPILRTGGANRLLAVHAAFWIVFYLIYFARMGW